MDWHVPDPKTDFVDDDDDEIIDPRAEVVPAVEGALIIFKNSLTNENDALCARVNKIHCTGQYA